MRGVPVWCGEVDDVDVRARFGVDAYWLMLRDPV